MATAQQIRDLITQRTTGSVRPRLPREVRDELDMRKQYDGLYALVVSELNADPLSGDLSLFRNRRRTRAKALLRDGTGLCVYQKRIERGRFAAPWREDDEETFETTLSELALFLEVTTLAGGLRLSSSPTSLQVLTSFLHETRRC